MNLVTFGCSFVQGVPNPDNPSETPAVDTVYQIDDFTYRTQVFNYVWPHLMAPYFNNVYNLAVAGSGNNQTIRSLNNFLTSVSKDTIKDSLFLISWTCADREEFLSNTGNWNQLNYLSGFGYEPRPPFEDPNNLDADKNNCNAFMSALQAYTVHLKTHEQDAYKTCQNIVLTQNLLDQYGVDKYLFTAMDWPGTGIDVDHPDIKMLTNLFYRYRFVEGIGELVDTFGLDKDTSFSCGHPNLESHEKIADYFVNELKNRRWI